jgi:AMME syndrome candidate gene 1 protein
VSLLHSFERGSAWDDWEIGVHGITIEFADPLTSSRRSATFLPEVPAHESWDKEETLHHLVRKAGYHVGATSALRRSIKLTRYRSTTYTLTYDEYRKIKEPRMFRSSKVEKAHAEEAVTVPAG